MNLFDELKRRKVLQTAAIYVAIAWGATEIIVTIADQFSLDNWVSQVTLIAFIVGFPITLFASWYVDVSATGFRATTPGKPLGAKSVVVLVGVTIAATVALWFLISPTELELETCPPGDPFCSASASLAVLPFSNLTGDDENDHLAAGLSDDLIALLARLDRLRIAAGRSSAIAAESKMSIADIGEALDVENVLEGRVQPGAGSLVIVAQLIDARSQFVFWTREFNIGDGLLSARQQISAAVAEALELDAVSSDTPGVRPTRSAEAYAAYLRGLQVRRVQGYGAADPLQHFSMATKLDPDFAEAHVALARTLLEMASGGLISADEAFTKARAATERALEIDPSLPQAYVMLGQLRRRGTQTAEALDALLRALELNPNDESAHLEVGRLLSNQGSLEAAMREFEIAYTLDPLNQLLDVYRATVPQLRGDYARAIGILKTQLAADPSSGLVYGNLQIVSLLSGSPQSTLQYSIEATEAGLFTDWNYAFRSIAESRLALDEAARQTVRDGVAVNPDNVWVRIAKLMRLASDGDAAGVRDYGDTLIGTGGNRHWRKWAAHGALMQGDYLAAAEYLEAAFAIREFYSGLFPAEEIVHVLNLVAAYRGLGDTEKAGAWLEIGRGRIQKLRQQDVSLPDLDYAEGALLVLEGDNEAGLEFLETAAMRGWLGWPIMRHDPKLETLRDDPRFEAIIARSP